jgi:hypothetical protein
MHNDFVIVPEFWQSFLNSQLSREAMKRSVGGNKSVLKPLILIKRIFSLT